jgi:hypothetical protein
MNTYGNICYVFNGSREMPADTLSFIESNESGKDTMVRGWLSQSCDVQNLHSRVAATLDEVQDFYNENYEDILEILYFFFHFFQKQLGFFLSFKY